MILLTGESSDRFLYLSKFPDYDTMRKRDEFLKDIKRTVKVICTDDEKTIKIECIEE